LLLGYSGGTNNGNGSGGAPELLFGIVLLIPGLILLAPFFLSVTARLGRRAPIATRLALRDLARYRARSGSALAAISLGVLVAVIVMLAAASRYGNVFDYAGPNLASNQLALHANTPPPVGTIVHARTERSHPKGVERDGCDAAAAGRARRSQIAKGLSAQLIALETPNAQSRLGPRGVGSWDGPIYVATPQLLRAFGITSSEIDPNADILSSRPGLSGVSGLGLELRIGWQERTGDRPVAVVRWLSRQPGHPRDRGATKWDVGAEHGDHRACHARVPHPGEHDRLADPGHAALQRLPDQQR
jgi:putative ABC transport system permease protein